MSQSGAASTASTEPSLRAMTSSRPRAISTTVWATGPPSKTREAPTVRLSRPAATAASWSARSSGNPSELARHSPSAGPTTACATPGVPRTNSVISQSNLLASRLSVVTPPPSQPNRPQCGIPQLARSLALCLVRPTSGTFTYLRTASPYALLEAGHAVADTLRADRRYGGRGTTGAGGGADPARHQVGLGSALGQTGGGDPAQGGFGRGLSGTPSLVRGGAPLLGVGHHALGQATSGAAHSGPRRLPFLQPLALGFLGAFGLGERGVLGCGEDLRLAEPRRLHGREDRQVLLLGLQRGDLDGGHRRRDRVLVLGRPRGEGLLLCRPRADGGLERVHRLGGRLVLPLLAAAEAAGVLLLRPRSGRIGAAEYALVLL